MRILLINKYNYRRGGAETVFLNTASLLRQHGHQVALFTTDHPKNDPSEWSQYFAHNDELRDSSTWQRIRRTPRFFHNRHAARQLRRLIDDFHPDVAHLHNIFNGLSIDILPVLHRARVPVVITMHDTRWVCMSTRFMRQPQVCRSCMRMAFAKGLWRNCQGEGRAIDIMCTMEKWHKNYLARPSHYIDRYIFLNNYYRDLHAQWRRYFAEKSTILPNFIPIPEQWDTTHDGYYLFFGRLSCEKGLMTLMEVARRLPQLQFRIAGSGPLEKEIRAMGLPNVRLEGFVSGEPLQRLIAQARFTVVPSEWLENNPMTVLESYSHGTPAIGAAIGGIPEIIRPGITGYLHEPANADELAACLRRADALSPDQYAEMSRASRAYALSDFAPEAHYRRLLDIYTDLLHSKP